MIVKKLPATLKIKDDKLCSCLATIEQKADEIWARDLISHYTNHGPDHSERIIKLLGQLLTQKPRILNDRERFILVAAVLLHDIGMQSPEKAGIEIKENYTIRELDTIRERHHISSAEMIEELLTSDSGKIDFKIAPDYISFIATVAKHHRQEDISKLKNSSLSGDKIKLPLLAALIRLGDELDRDHSRVNLGLLDHTDIPVKSKYHWWSHHFVQSITANKGKIELYFRFPKGFENGDLVNVFQENIFGSIDKQLIEVYELLDSYKLRLYRSPIIKETRFVTDTEANPIPDDLMEYINSNVLKVINTVEELDKKDGTSWFIGGVAYSDDVEVVKRINKITDLFYAEKHKEAAKEINNCMPLMMSPKDRMSFCIIAGNCLLTLGDLQKAEEYLLEALGISERKDIQGIIKKDADYIKSAAYCNTGLIYKDKGDYKKAIKYFEDALQIDRKIGNRLGESDDLGNIGVVYGIIGDLDIGLKYFNDALMIIKEIGSSLGEAITLGNIGNIYNAKGELNIGLRYYNDALKINQKIGYRRGEANDLGNIGNIYYKLRDINKAFKYLNDALRIHQEIGYCLGEAIGLANFGLIYKEQGDNDKALEFLQQALDILNEHGLAQGKDVIQDAINEMKSKKK